MKLRSLEGAYAGLLGSTPRSLAKNGRGLAHHAPPELAVADLQAARTGPGGGPDATPSGMSKALVAVMANGPRSQMPERVAARFNMAPPGDAAPGSDAGIVPEGGDLLAGLALPGACAITGQGHFGDALAVILASPGLAERVDRVEMRRDAEEARIIMRDGRVQRFLGAMGDADMAKHDAAGGLRVVASLGGAVLASIARDLAEAA